MDQKPRRRTRDPVATREAILAAARTLIARDGPDGLSLSEVAQLAGVNRGTAYQRFSTREKLVEATLESVSNMLFEATFGSSEAVAAKDVIEIDVLALTQALADFAINNPALCRIWFLQLLASEHPDEDRFMHQYLESFRAFAETEYAVPGIDSEIVTLMTLSANFLWPVWAKAHEKSDEERRKLARRFVDEALRMSMFGTMRAERYPELARRVGSHEGDQPLRALAGGR
ncbi:TetR/AcrR family transcriptional regulator [Sphingomonas tabacisoli]|uniref:TetR/AcrR family transcriptional regulator n=1 Tax=Sphingomonas tabacisoli TaxID=2249466 RepID=A0ABW4I7F8_9SPHN